MATAVEEVGGVARVVVVVAVEVLAEQLVETVGVELEDTAVSSDPNIRCLASAYSASRWDKLFGAAFWN